MFRNAIGMWNVWEYCLEMWPSYNIPILYPNPTSRHPTHHYRTGLKQNINAAAEKRAILFMNFTQKKNLFLKNGSAALQACPSVCQCGQSVSLFVWSVRQSVRVVGPSVCLCGLSVSLSVRFVRQSVEALRCP